MKPKERVIAVLKRAKSDKVPVLVRSMANKIQYQYAAQYEIDEEDQVFYWRDVSPLIAMGIDAFDFSLPIKKPSSTQIKGLMDGESIDAYGRISRNGSYSRGYFENKDIFESFPPINVVDADDPKHFKKLIDGCGKKIALFCSLRGFFELTWEGMGLVNFSRAQRKDTSFIDAVCSRIFDFTRQQLQNCLDAGLKLFSITDDMGFKAGLMVQHDFLKNHFIDHYKELTSMIHDNDGLVYLHSEGNVTEAIPSIIEAGFDGLQALTPMDGVDLAAINEIYGEKISWLGTMAHSPMLDMWPQERIRNHVKKQFKNGGDNGGLMLGPSAMIDEGCKLESVLTMIDEIHKCAYE